MTYFKNILLILLLFSLTLANAQQSGLATFDGKVLPKFLVKKVKKLTEKDSLEADKFYHICAWIIKKKRYDTKRFERIDFKHYSFEKIIKKKKLLCGEYAALLEAMCKLANIECHGVIGYTKSADHYPFKKIYYNTHKWNVVKIDGSYRIADVTWAAGYLRSKISLLGHVKILLKIPYIPRKWKFVRKPNVYYLDMPPEKSILTHLPAHPMWQLLDFPLSINSFERGWDEVNTDSILDTYSYLSKIQHYSGLNKEDQLHLIIEEGYKYNPQNNLLKGAGNLEIAYRKWSRLVEPKEVLLKEKAEYSAEVLKFSKDAEIFLKFFLKDNDLIKRNCYDSLRRKNREINAFINKNNSLISRKFFLLKSNIRKHHRWVSIENSNIHYKRRVQDFKTSSGPIYNIRRLGHKKFTSDTLVKWMQIVNTNTASLSSLEALYKTRNDSVVDYVIQRTLLWDTLVYQANLRQDIIEAASFIDIMQNDIHGIREMHTDYLAIQKEQLVTEKRLVSLEKYYDIRIQKYCDSVIMAAAKLIEINKSLLLRIKRFNIHDGSEDAFYKQQNEILYKWHEYSIDKHQLEIEHLHAYKVFHKAWKKQAKSECEAFKEYRKVEDFCYHSWKEHERYRHQCYSRAGNRAITSSVRLSNVSKQHINNYARFIKRATKKKLTS